MELIALLIGVIIITIAKHFVGFEVVVITMLVYISWQIHYGIKAEKEE